MPEEPITSPIVKEVFGPTAENVSIAFRSGGVNTEDEKYVTLADMILANGNAGLIDFRAPRLLLFSSPHSPHPSTLCSTASFPSVCTPPLFSPAPPLRSLPPPSFLQLPPPDPTPSKFHPLETPTSPPIIPSSFSPCFLVSRTDTV